MSCQQLARPRPGTLSCGAIQSFSARSKHLASNAFKRYQHSYLGLLRSDVSTLLLPTKEMKDSAVAAVLLEQMVARTWKSLFRFLPGRGLSVFQSSTSQRRRI